ncbi:uncharacterized protein BYT42DRAFT_373527 [Radiomyces spectabilis]|uniref:uncharacterized protein n=1 Tax=Radiomyces spectabilis TaxID=64574 RepID=UPI002220B71A|nr:uncharacterized protein BYT42DRAFT_373527 [Radiomyces spectabilis]KAI8376071.1 hypothetical protein BYT42DRAFT_373527 [Radiomyces spectabilis]
MKTDIYFDFDNQYFDIKGRSQKACDETMRLIVQVLLPHLHKEIDEMKLDGTYPKVSSGIVRSPSEDRASPMSRASSRSSMSRPASTRASSSSDVFRATGKPLDLSKLDNDKDDSDSDHSDGSDDNSDANTFKDTFTFAKNIANPQDVLVGPPMNNMQKADYLTIVGDDTDTQCWLDGRQVHIVGSSEEDVQEALSRFRNLQTIYKRRKRGKTIVPCVHYPTESPHYGLYFCDIERYVYKNFIGVQGGLPSPLYVLLPVFKDASGQYQKPKDMIDLSPPAMPKAPIPAAPQWVPHQHFQEQQAYNQRMLNETMSAAQTTPKKQPRPKPPQQRGSGSMRPSAPSTPSGQTSPLPEWAPVDYQNIAPDSTPLWGEHRTFMTERSTTPRPSSGNSYASHAAPPVASPVAKPQEDFPALPSAPKKPSMASQMQGLQRRVMRLNLQKAGRPKPPTKSLLEMAKEYNLHNMKTALEDGLNGVRGFRGEIKLGAKLGKVMWDNLSADVRKKIWQFQEIKDVVVKELGVRPVFNNMTTASEETITRISEILPSPFSKIAYFEIHANARNQPALPYKPVIMYMNQGHVELQKVVMRKDTITEIDWISLDRKLDFQVSLTTQELGRTDVKPYTTFIKKVSVSPITRQMTYENIPDFLEVTHILLKQTTKYRIHFPFVVEITRVERLPLQRQKSMGYGVEKIMGVTGKGQVWYDLEVFYTLHNEPFKSNLELPVGKLVSWTVEDILGGEDQTSALVEYVRCLLLLVEKSEALLS